MESALITSNSTDIQDALLVGDTVTKTRGQLKQEGFSLELINTLPATTDKDNQLSSLADIRFDDQGGIHQEDFRVWANQKVRISDMVVKIDKDGDGVAERRHIVKSGDVILEDEPFEIVPYVLTSALLMSHNAIGLSRAELTLPSARIKTTLLRGMLDNSYAHNAPQIGVNENVNYDDLLTKRPNGIVRTRGEANPGQSIFPINVDYIGDRALQVVQYADQAKAQTTGTIIASQGLGSDDFGKETATRFNGVQDASKAKIELVARVIAETAYKQLYSGIAWMVSQYQTTEMEIMVLGKPLSVNPSNWKFKHQVKSTIGLGSGDGDKNSQSLSGIYAIQQQLLAAGSPLVDQVKIYNTLDATLKSLDIQNTSQFFNNPERQEQLVVAENEVLRSTVQQLQVALQQLQAQAANPLAEAETIKAQAKLVEAQSKQQIEVAKLAEDARQFDVDTQQSAQQFVIDAAQKQETQDQKTAVELTKLEVENNQNIPGSIV